MTFDLFGLGSLFKKLPSLKGLSNYFYVAANWERISKEQKEREELMTLTLAQKDRLHGLVQEEMRHRLARMESLAERAIGVASRSEAAFEALQRQVERSGTLFKEVTDDAINTMVVLAQALLQEDEATRNVLLKQLGTIPRTFVERVMRQLLDNPAKIAPSPPPAPPPTLPPPPPLVRP